MRKQVLGRGLEALISQDLRESVSETERVRELDINSVDPNPRQPRENFDQKNLKELADSIRSNGVLQPVVVRRVGERYQLVVGERRFRACRMAGKNTIPALVRTIEEEDSLKLALMENLQREDLNPVEEAKGYRALKEEYSLSPKEIADLLGRDRSTVANTLRLLNLPEKVLKLLEGGKIKAGHARALLSIEGEEEQLEWARKIIELRFTVRDIERAVPGSGRKNKGRKKVDPLLRELEERSEKYLGTRVKIMPRAKGGVVRIEYYAEEELVDILNKIGVDTVL
ncbi:MAG: ParB/RepB/Spo0J family partition protein [Candidatus Krumholzibacteriota bacterium]|nr:ParB/RepB/Spo0J family partition protein [Candidatus Krumholzibacteriota bacterium]